MHSPGRLLLIMCSSDSNRRRSLYRCSQGFVNAISGIANPESLVIYYLRTYTCMVVTVPRLKNNGAIFYFKKNIMGTHLFSLHSTVLVSLLVYENLRRLLQG